MTSSHFVWTFACNVCRVSPLVSSRPDSERSVARREVSVCDLLCFMMNPTEVVESRRISPVTKRSDARLLCACNRLCTAQFPRASKWLLKRLPLTCALATQCTGHLFASQLQRTAELCWRRRCPMIQYHRRRCGPGVSSLNVSTTNAKLVEGAKLATFPASRGPAHSAAAIGSGVMA